MEDLDLLSSLNLADKLRGNSEIHRGKVTVLILKSSVAYVNYVANYENLFQ